MTWIQFRFFSKICRCAAFWRDRDPGHFFIQGWKAAKLAAKEKKRPGRRLAKQMNLFEKELANENPQDQI